MFWKDHHRTKNYHHRTKEYFPPFKSTISRSKTCAFIIQISHLENWMNSKCCYWWKFVRQSVNSFLNSDLLFLFWWFFMVIHWECSYKISIFSAGPSQVKWNHKNEYLFASAHDGDVRVWDTRVRGINILYSLQVTF